MPRYIYITYYYGNVRVLRIERFALDEISLEIPSATRFLLVEVTQDYGSLLD